MWPILFQYCPNAQTFKLQQRHVEVPKICKHNLNVDTIRQAVIYIFMTLTLSISVADGTWDRIHFEVSKGKQKLILSTQIYYSRYKTNRKIVRIIFLSLFPSKFHFKLISKPTIVVIGTLKLLKVEHILYLTHIGILNDWTKNISTIKQKRLNQNEMIWFRNLFPCRYTKPQCWFYTRQY